MCVCEWRGGWGWGVGALLDEAPAAERLHPPSSETPPTQPLSTCTPHTHTPCSPSPPLSIISIWCGQPVCVVLISSNKSVIIAVPSLLSLPSFSPPALSFPLTLSLSLPPFFSRSCFSICPESGCSQRSARASMAPRSSRLLTTCIQPRLCTGTSR